MRLHLLQQCHEIVDQISVEQRWSLTEAAREQYAEFIAVNCEHIRQPNMLALSTMLRHYHTEHPIVEALCDSAHPEHAERWAEWVQKVVQLLTIKINTSATAERPDMSIEDLTQEALHDLWRGLRAYRYECRFRTWAFTVISNSLGRHYRALYAQKRGASAPAQSLDELMAGGGTLYENPTQQPESIALGATLSASLTDILARQPDQRLITIFLLWAYEGQPLRAISTQLNISISRVHTLLQQAIDVLRCDPFIQRWIEAETRASHTI